MTPPRHILTIGPGTPGGMEWHGHILFDDGTETDLYADERPRLIAKAQLAVAQYHTQRTIIEETLILDEFGEIVREPVAHSMKVRG